MPVSFSPMAYGDKDLFTFNFGKVLASGDYILNGTTDSPTITVGPGITLDGSSVAVVGTAEVTCIIEAGRMQITSPLACEAITNDGYTLTRTGFVPVLPVVPS